MDDMKRVYHIVNGDASIILYLHQNTVDRLSTSKLKQIWEEY